MTNVLQKISAISFGLLIVPFIVSAQTQGLQNLLRSIYDLLQSVVPVLIALGLIGFLWGVVLYLFSKDKANGKEVMLYGIIALFVMTSVWGLVGILRGTLFSGNDNANNVDLPDYR